jgi:DNA-binding NtrC family response regulator
LSARRPPTGALARLYPTLEGVADSLISVLVLGETGVGKEVLAQRVHAMSSRRAEPFVGVNCAAFTETLLESELFGHEKGAFTGANSTKEGLLESARGGTVFFDEVGEMPLALQAKLLRVLELRSVRRVGAVRSRPIDVRFIAATNKDLRAEADRGTFRRDLYYRLNGVTVTLPPLRERKDELLDLADLFLAKVAAARGEPPVTLTREAEAVLYAHDWPGNVRELKNAIELAVVLAKKDSIGPEHLVLETRPEGVEPRPTPAPWRRASMRDVVRALEACGGNQTKAARLLGVSRRTLTSRLDEYGLPRPRK